METIMPKNGYIEIFSGKLINPLNLKEDDIDIVDVAHSLSNQCRFSGHCKFHYSVALHSYYVSQMCSDENKLWGLMHDLSESYIIDIPSPIKILPEFRFYREIENNIQNLACNKFGLPQKMPKEVNIIDKRMSATEMFQIMNTFYPNGYIKFDDVKIEELSPEQTKKLFLDQFYRLVKHK